MAYTSCLTSCRTLGFLHTRTNPPRLMLTHTYFKHLYPIIPQSPHITMHRPRPPNHKSLDNGKWHQRNNIGSWWQNEPPIGSSPTYGRSQHQHTKSTNNKHKTTRLLPNSRTATKSTLHRRYWIHPHAERSTICILPTWKVESHKSSM